MKTISFIKTKLAVLACASLSVVAYATYYEDVGSGWAVIESYAGSTHGSVDGGDYYAVVPSGSTVDGVAFAAVDASGYAYSSISGPSSVSAVAYGYDDDYDSFSGGGAGTYYLDVYTESYVNPISYAVADLSWY